MTRKDDRRKKSLKKRAARFAEEVVEAGYRIKTAAQKKENRKRFKKEIKEAAFRVKEIADEIFPRRKMSKIEYGFAILVNLFLIYIFNHLLYWGVPFLTSAFVMVLWAFNLSLLANIVVNLFYLFYDEKWFKNIGELCLNIFGFNAMYQLSVYYPFDFGMFPIDLAVRLGIFFAMIIIAFTIVYRVMKLFKFAFGFR